LDVSCDVLLLRVFRAQLPTATLNGRSRTHKRLIPAAKVVVRSGHWISRDATTGAEASTDHKTCPGPYNVKADVKGFAPRESRGGDVQLEVGRIQTWYALAVGALEGSDRHRDLHGRRPHSIHLSKANHPKTLQSIP